MPPLRMLLALGLSLVFYIHQGWAANCTLTSWSWANNSLGQDPCAVISHLEQPCWGVGGLLPLTPGTNYVTPQRSGNPPNLPCECNTVMYSLYQACTGCQNASLETWSFYEQYCDAVYVSQYPVDIPLDTRIPHWAFLNVTGAGIFDPTAASLAGDLPESTPVTPSTVRPSATSTTSLGSSTSGSSSIRPPSPSSSTVTKSSKTSTIAGGTVGGVVGLALIGGAIAYFLYRRRQAASLSELSLVTDPSNGSGGIAMTANHAPLRTYNPSDPSTFPQPLDQITKRDDNPIYYNGSGSSDYPQVSRGGYQGYAEV